LKDESLDVEFKYFDTLYYKPFIFDFVSLNDTNIPVEEIRKICKREEESGRDPSAEIHSHLGKIIKEESQKK
jgi:hypothetical protein